MDKSTDISLIVPCYNEARNLGAFFQAVVECFAQTQWKCEVVFVNDGSADDTMIVLEEAIVAYQQRDDAADLNDPMTFVLVELSRNFGKEAALYAGLQRAHGRYVGFIDADMQQDPHVALEMFCYLDTHPEYDCVAAVQDKRKEGAVLRGFKQAFYLLFNGMSDTKILANVSDFRVFTRKVADALLMLGEQFRFSKGLFAWVGFRTHVITYEVHDRLAGKSRWSFTSLASYAWNGILAFSTWPLKLIMLVGVVLALVSIVLLGFDVVHNAISTDDVSMSQILLEVVLLLGGIQMFVLGVIGEYVARAYIEAKQRPVCIVQEEFSTAEMSSQRMQEILRAQKLLGKRGGVRV